MKKKLVIVAMVALVALVAVTPALAAGSDTKGGPQLFSVLGTITDKTGGTITVEVSDASRLGWPYIGTDLTVYMTPNTLFYRWTANGLLPIEFEDVAVGDTTNVHGRVTDDVFTADRVTVDP